MVVVKVMTGTPDDSSYTVSPVDSKFSAIV